MTRAVIGTAVGLLLLGAACGDDASSSTDAAATKVTLTANGCDPLALSAAAGAVTFEVSNSTEDKAEFEILSPAPEILAEEFVEAGKTGTYTITLPAGSYEIICGAPSDPRAKLTVTGDGAAAPASTVVDAAELAEATAQYQAYVNEQVALLQSGTTKFTDAVRAGDTELAKSLYAEVRIPWELIEPVAELFPDADGVIDSRADDFEKAEADPEFTGFHAIEYGLWAQGTIDGATVDLPALADRLDADIAELIANIKSVTIQPQVMTNGAAALIEEAAQTKITGEEERYSHTDLVTFSANVDGSRKVFDLIEPLLRTVNNQLADDITSSFTEVGALLDPYRDGAGFKSYETVSEADRAKFKTSMAQLSESLSQVTGSLGLTVAS
ncbi:MAG: iron uptake system protein EfeO [Acidimicrobiia bacterium]